MLQIFYVTVNPERGTGVENIVPLFHIVYSDNNQIGKLIADEGINVKNIPLSGNYKLNSTSKILEESLAQEYINIHSHEKPDILVFKNDPRIEKICKDRGYKLLNPESALNRRYENKVDFSSFLYNEKSFKQPKYEVFEKLQDAEFKNIKEKFGREFIVQMMYGHSGDSTFFIHNESELEDLKQKYPQRRCKAVEIIKGHTYTVNACVTKLGVIVGGISEQITGHELFTSATGGTIGNDFTQRHVTNDLRKNIIKQVQDFGELIEKEGHRGIFGIDIIIEEGTEDIYFIEANLRQVASASFFSYLQQGMDQIPIMLWHILELTDFDYSTRFDSLDDKLEEQINNEMTQFRLANDRLSYNLDRNFPVKASQVIFRNTNDYAVKVMDQFPSGIYRIRGRVPNEAAVMEHGKEYLSVYSLREDGWSTLCLMEKGYNILQAIDEQGFVIQTAGEGSIIPPNGEIGRIQLLDTAFTSIDSKGISGWVSDTVEAIYENSSMMKIVDKEDGKE